MSDSPIDCLKRAVQRDAEKGGAGVRSTRDVADYCGLSMAATRKALWALVEAGQVDAFDAGAAGHSGNAIMWRVK